MDAQASADGARTVVKTFQYGVPWTKRLRHVIERWLVEAVSAVVQPQPMVRVRAWGEALGRLAHRCAGSRRRVALDNLVHAFPEMPLAERERWPGGYPRQKKMPNQSVHR